MHLLNVLVLASGIIRPVFSSSILFPGATIIAFDEEAEALKVIRNGALLVTDDKISGLYAASEIPSAGDLPPDTEVVDSRHKIITPGFIDTHRHGWQTALKTLGSNTTLPEYLYRYRGAAAAAVYTAEDVYISQLAGLLEALHAGVTTTLDHAHHIWSTARSRAGLDASVDSGARVYWAPSFTAHGDYGVAAQIADVKGWVEEKRSGEGEGGDALTTIAVAYDDWESPNIEETQAVVDFVKDYKIPLLTTHWLGGTWPKNNHPELLDSYSMLNTSTAVVFSHGTGVTPASAALLRATDQFVSVTPESEMHYGHSHPAAHRVLDQAALGVDTHFAFSADVLTQARLWLQRTRSRLYDDLVVGRWRVPAASPMSAAQAFLLATRQGARALRRPDLGAIKLGAKADLVVFDGRSPGLLGWNDPVAAVVLHAGVGDMVHVLVDGRFRKRDGRLTFAGYADDVAERFLASAERLQRRLLLRAPPPVLEGRMFGFGCEYARPEVVDVRRGDGDGYGELFL
ncbi:hypothetical protein F5X96DRAFT_685573 [Biscogniauxia mediterranea]|nr:hypothetical protein F5X96DRAFT_685573 [Biscogniauxia mediterranea]